MYDPGKYYTFPNAGLEKRFDNKSRTYSKK
jgi:hypothetical protein